MDNNDNGAPNTDFSGPGPQTGEPMGQPVPPEVNAMGANTSVEQPTPQPTPMQPLMAQPVMNQPTTSAVPSAGNAGTKKKTGLIVGCILGICGIAIVAAVVLLMFFSGGGEKTVSCTASTTIMGIDIESETSIRIQDGGLIGGDIITNVNLQTLSSVYKSREEELVDGIIESYESQCTDHCTFSHDYAAGDYVKLTMKYDGEGVGDLVYAYGIEDKSAQEIADKIQESMEKTGGATCKQS